MPPLDDSSAAPVEKRSDFGDDSKGQCAYWKSEIRACDKELDTWRDRGEKVVKRYKDEETESAIATTRGKRYNILWSNIRTLKPAIFGRAPQAVVMRRYKDPDQVARVASMILERTIAYQLDAQKGFVPALKAALEDRLLPGMGTVWVRYEETARKAPAAATPTVTTNAEQATAVDCMAKVDYVHWRDFGFIPGRTWEEVPAVWRSVFMDREALVKRFGEQIGNAVPLDYTANRYKDASGGNSEEPKSQVFKQARVYEVWDKRTGKVTWLNMAYDDLLDQKDDPIGFPGFFPCPKPLFATNTTGNLIPTPDYCLYQDQAGELDELTERLYWLTKALKVVGVYDAENAALQRIFTEGFENQLIPVDSWAAFAEKGGIKGTLDFVPIQQIVEVVDKLHDKRASLIQDIYQITGLSDIVRGSTNPNETAAAQRIKAQFASVRLEDMKGEMASFATEVLERMAHIVSELFPNEAIVEQSAIMESIDGQKVLEEARQAMAAKQQAAAAQAMPPGMPPQPGTPPSGPLPNGQPSGPAPVDNYGGAQPPQPLAVALAGIVPPGSVVDQAIQLLRDKRSTFRVEVAADSMVEPDLNAERQARNEFITAVTQFLQQAVPAAQQNPAIAPLLNALLLWGVRGFRVGRDIEGMIEGALEGMEQAAKQAAQAGPPPDPKVEALKQKAQLDREKQQGDMAMEQQRLNNELMQMREEMANERARTQAEIQAIHDKAMADVQAILLKAGIQAKVTQQAAVAKAEATAIQGQATVENNARAFEQQLQHGEAAHAQSMAHAEESAATEAAAGDTNNAKGKS